MVGANGGDDSKYDGARSGFACVYANTDPSKLRVGKSVRATRLCESTEDQFPTAGTSYRDGCAPIPSHEPHSSYENSAGEFRRGVLPFQTVRSAPRACRFPADLQRKWNPNRRTKPATPVALQL